MLSDATSSLNKDRVASYVHGKNFRDGQDTAVSAVLDANATSVHHNLQGRKMKEETWANIQRSQHLWIS